MNLSPAPPDRILREQQRIAFDYGALVPATRRLVKKATADIRDRVARSAAELIEIGQRLIEVKLALEHGEFGDWLEAEFGWSERTARNLMSVATVFRDCKSATVAVIGAGALYLLASDSTPEEVRQRFIEAAESGQPVTQAEVRKALSEEEPEEEAPDLALKARVLAMVGEEGFGFLLAVKSTLEAIVQTADSEPAHIRLKAAEQLEQTARQLRMAS